MSNPGPYAKQISAVYFAHYIHKFHLNKINNFAKLLTFDISDKLAHSVEFLKFFLDYRKTIACIC